MKNKEFDLKVWHYWIILGIYTFIPIKYFIGRGWVLSWGIEGIVNYPLEYFVISFVIFLLIWFGTYLFYKTIQKRKQKNGN